MHVFNSNTQETHEGGSLEAEASLVVYIASSRTAKDVQKDSCLRKKSSFVALADLKFVIPS